MGGGAARTLGYYEPDDGGGAIYNIVEDDALVDDGGSVHDLDNNLKAKLIIDGNYNIKQFGAHGDGIVDDTVPFQSCINYAQTSKQVFQIKIPVGTYLISHRIDLGYGFNQPNIIGESGNLCKIIMSSNASEQTPIFYAKAGSGGVHDYKIENIYFQDNGTNHIGICFEGGASQTIVSLCHFNNFDKAIKLLNSGNEFTEFSKIRDCDFRNNNYCFYLAKTGTQNSFHGFEIWGCTVGEKTAGENVIYLEPNCVWYNGLIDITVWKKNTNPLIYNATPSTAATHNRFMSLTGTIKIEGDQKFNLFGTAGGR